MCGKKSIKAVFAVVRCLFIFGTLGFYWQTPGLMQCLLDQQYVPNRLIYWIGGPPMKRGGGGEIVPVEYGVSQAWIGGGVCNICTHGVVLKG